MAKAKSKKRAPANSKYDLVIRAKATATRITEISNTSVRIESSEKGKVGGRYYSGTHWDTVEAAIVSNGSAMLTIRFMHVTNTGETIVGTGTGTQGIPSSKGIAKVSAEGTIWTSSPRLIQLNAARWTVEGEYNTIKETVEVRGNFQLAT